jgi:hypothetical protein
MPPLRFSLASRKSWSGLATIVVYRTFRPTTHRIRDREGVMASEAINLRIRKQDKYLLQQAAEIEGKTLSTFLRDCAYKAAHEVLSTPRLVIAPPQPKEVHDE